MALESFAVSSQDKTLAGLSKEKLTLIAQAISIHEMHPEVTNWLAKEHKIYTTTEPRDPGSLLRFHKEMETKRALGRLRDNARSALNHPEYRNESKLGHKLACVFGAVTDVKVEGVHYDKEPKNATFEGYLDKSARAKTPILGTAIADKITFTVPLKDDADLLSLALQGLLRSGKIEDTFPVRTYKEQGKHFVEVLNMTEYTNRVIGNAISQLVAEDDLIDTGTILPPGKHSLKYWKEHGETFHPDVQARLEKLNEAYQTLGLQTYKNYRTEQVGKDLNLLGTDAAAVFQVVRDAFRPTIHHYRGGDHHNKEQNPDKSKRLLIETGVHLIRDKASDPEAVKSGPRSPRTLSTRESLEEKARTSMREALEDKRRAGLKLAAKVVSAGTETVVEASLLAIPNITEFGQTVNHDKRQWNEEKRRVAESRAKIANLVVDLLLEDKK